MKSLVMENLTWDKFSNLQRVAEEASLELMEKIEVYQPLVEQTQKFNEEIIKNFLKVQGKEMKDDFEPSYHLMHQAGGIAELNVEGKMLDTFIAYDKYRSEFESRNSVNVIDSKTGEKRKPRVYRLALLRVKGLTYPYDYSNNEDNDMFYSLKTEEKYVLNFIEGQGFFVEKKRGGYFPLNGRSLLILMRLNNELGEALLEDLSKVSYGGLDFYNEYKKSASLILASPYSVNDYILSNNKAEFVRANDGLVSENDIKRFPVIFASYLRLAKKHIMERDYQKFRNYLTTLIERPSINFEFPPAKEFYSLIGLYYRDKYKNLSWEESRGISYASDYAKMMIDLKEKVSLSLSPKSVKNRHDSVTIRHRNEYYMKKYGNDNPEVKYHKKFNLIAKSIDELKPILFVEEFAREGEVQNNCVFGYMDSVKDGRCLIMSGLVNDEYYTVEIQMRDNWFFINQMMRKNNVRAKEQDFLVIQKQISELNNKRKYQGSEELKGKFYHNKYSLPYIPDENKKNESDFVGEEAVVLDLIIPNHSNYDDELPF